MVFYAVFNSISVISRATAHIIHAFLGFTSTRLGSEVSCPRTLPRKNPEDPVRLEPRTPGLRVKHFTTKPHGTPDRIKNTVGKEENASYQYFLLFPQYLQKGFFPLGCINGHVPIQVWGTNLQFEPLLNHIWRTGKLDIYA